MSEPHEFLWSQPCAFALQRMLEHLTLDMVSRQLAIAQTEFEVAHQGAVFCLADRAGRLAGESCLPIPGTIRNPTLRGP